MVEKLGRFWRCIWWGKEESKKKRKDFDFHPVWFDNDDDSLFNLAAIFILTSLSVGPTLTFSNEYT